ncbi:hypothetical protein CONLIGDRAFT_638405 [Coniochaeta ligniaria NRRL 30616]|uniref:Uncharacterized protein n=1 Tax=Coniochaeta ligniaria NRRL 30616 TaxID=1408157 RepID=A0A1J7I4B4_9PEZI|nr:hypothetical protein CONLIGDRAFT_638405 [Coniochaeta ligniaria NRRL 30616]
MPSCLFFFSSRPCFPSNRSRSHSRLLSSRRLSHTPARNSTLSLAPRTSSALLAKYLTTPCPTGLSPFTSSIIPSHTSTTSLLILASLHTCIDKPPGSGIAHVSLSPLLPRREVRELDKESRSRARAVMLVRYAAARTVWSWRGCWEGGTEQMGSGGRERAE